MNTISTYTSPYGMQQITVTSEETGRKALMTRFKHDRTWAVRCGYLNDVQLHIAGHDGQKTQFLKATALELANRWVDDGYCFL